MHNVCGWATDAATTSHATGNCSAAAPTEGERDRLSDRHGDSPMDERE